MANVQVAGFRPRSRGGNTAVLVRRPVGSNNTTAIFKGDAVEAGSGGLWVVAAATNNLIGGVQWGGASYMSSGVRLERKYLPAATTFSGTAVDNDQQSFIYVTANNADQEFEASVDEALAHTDLNLNYVMVLGTGSTTSGESGHELDATSRATTATLPWRVTDFVMGDPKSDVTAADAHVVCMINAGQTEPALSDYTGT